MPAPTLDDLFRLRVPSDPQRGPDGRVAYVVRRVLRDHDRCASDIHVAGDGAWTHGDASDTHPRWSPDGRWLAFLSDRDAVGKPPTLWLLPARGGEARKVWDQPVSAFAWSPDGARLAVVHRPRAPEGPVKARVVTRLRYKADGVGYLPEARAHVWVLDLAGHARPLTDGDADCVAPAWSPDGRRVAFLSERRPDADRLPECPDVWVVDAEGGPARRWTRIHGPKAPPSWSPDGARIAFVGHDRPLDGGWSNDGVWVSDGVEDRCLTAGFDRPCQDVTLGDQSELGGPAAPAWDGDAIVVLASDRGATRRVRVTEAGVTPLDPGDRHVSAFAGDWTIRSDAASPPELFHGERRVSDLAPDVDWLAPVELEARASDGWPVHGWVLRPPGEGPHPLILSIHGGPMAQYGRTFFFELQLFAAMGWGVVYVNPRGSQGYGEAHCQAIRRRWGTVDMDDVLSAVDAVVAQGWVDERRLAITGGSYGGFMTNWVIGRSDRFRVAATDRCVSNFATLFGTSDYGWTFEHEVGAPLWEDPNAWWEMSPLARVAHIRTPLLICHGEADRRTEIEQAEQLYTALRLLGREAVLVRFPEESHGYTRGGTPSRRAERLRVYVDWFRRHLG
ncbi:MAG: S9 family peptidase [Myxococcota bacterium]